MLEAMAEAMVTLDQDSALREKLIAAGHTQLERFSWSKCAKATLEVYGELVWGGGYFVFDRTFFLFYVGMRVLRLLSSRALCRLSRPSTGIAVAELLSHWYA